MGIDKSMIIATICAVVRDKVLKIIENSDFEGWRGQVKIGGRTFQISVYEEKEEQ